MRAVNSIMGTKFIRGMACGVIGGMMATASAMAAPIMTFEAGPAGNLSTQMHEGTWDSGQYMYTGDWVTDDWTLDWNLSASPGTSEWGPFIEGIFQFTNTTSVTQTFVLRTTLGLTETFANTTAIGSVGASLEDNSGDGNGATLIALDGNPLFMGEIDGIGVLPLYPDPTTLYVMPGEGSAHLTGDSDSIDTGITATSTIGITYTFALTPGDTVEFGTLYAVVPEPGAAAMLLVGGAALLLRRRTHGKAVTA